MSRFLVLAALVGLPGGRGCTNNPYPDADRDKKVLYSSFHEAPKTLDPGRRLQHRRARHHRQRLRHAARIPLPRAALPADPRPCRGRAREPQPVPDGRQAYRFQHPPGRAVPRPIPASRSSRKRPPDAARSPPPISPSRWRASPTLPSTVRSSAASPRCWALPTSASGSSSCAARTPAFAAPAAPTSSTPAPAALRASSRTASRELEIVLAEPNAQILYWFAMPFTTPVAWEAVAYYNGRDGREHFADHAVGTGPYRLALYEKQFRFTLERNAAGTAACRANREAPGAVFPGSRSIREDIAEGRIDAAYAGRRMPFVDRVKFYREREDIPRFNKFLQGYYDDGGIIKESFDAVVQSDRLSPRDGRRAACASTRRWSRPSSMSASTWRTRSLGHAGGRAGPQAAPGHEHRHRCQAVPRAVPQRPRRAGAVAAAAGDLRLRRRATRTRSASTTSPARASCWPRPATGTASIPATEQRLQAELRHLGDHGRGEPAVRVPGRRLARRSASTSRSTPPPTTNSRTRCGAAPTRSSSGAGSADFPDPENFFFLLECGIGALQERRARTRPNFCDAEFDRLYREMKDMPNNERARRPHPAHAGDPGAGAALDRALPPRELRAEPRLARQLQAHGHLLSRLQVQGRQTRAARAACRPNGTRRCAGRSISC